MEQKYQSNLYSKSNIFPTIYSSSVKGDSDSDKEFIDES